MKKQYRYLLLWTMLFISFEIAFDFWIYDASKSSQLVCLIFLVAIAICGFATYNMKKGKVKNIKS